MMIHHKPAPTGTSFQNYASASSFFCSNSPINDGPSEASTNKHTEQACLLRDDSHQVHELNGPQQPYQQQPVQACPGQRAQDPSHNVTGGVAHCKPADSAKGRRGCKTNSVQPCCGNEQHPISGHSLLDHKYMTSNCGHRPA